LNPSPAASMGIYDFNLVRSVGL